MGFLSNLFSAGIAINRMAKAFDECLNCIALFRITNDTNEIYKAAWIYTYGVQKSSEKWNWNIFSTKIIIPNHIELGRITINQAIMLTLYQISITANQLSVSQVVNDILEGGIEFENKSYLVSQQIKNKVKP